MKKYIVIICLTIYMVAGSILGSVMQSYEYGNCEQLNSSDALYADAAQAYIADMIQYCTEKSYLEVLTPLLLLLIVIYRPKIDIFDIIYAAIVTLSGAISVVDWHVNANTRDTTEDFIVIGSILFLIILIKLKYHGFRFITKIR